MKGSHRSREVRERPERFSQKSVKGFHLLLRGPKVSDTREEGVSQKLEWCCTVLGKVERLNKKGRETLAFAEANQAVFTHGNTCFKTVFNFARSLLQVHMRFSDMCGSGVRTDMCGSSDMCGIRAAIRACAGRTPRPALRRSAQNV